MTETMTDPLTSSLRERKKLATRRAIHSVALRLVSENGPEGVTIEEICAEVGVSPRTFFNYYPTKIAAAFDLAETEISPQVRERFLSSTGNLIADICDLVASGISVPSDYPRVKELLTRRPELSFTFWQQMNLRKQPVIETITERVGDRDAAGSAFGLVMVAIMAMMRQHGETNPDAIATRLKAEVRKLATMIGDCGKHGPAAS